MSGTTQTRFIRDPLTLARLWHSVDAAGHRVGRLSTQIARVLIGKHKPTYTPSVDSGDYVVVYNAEKVVFTGKKWTEKLYRWHTRYPGGLKEVPAKNMLLKHPDNIIRKAVRGMLPKNRLREHRMRRLRIFVGTEHPHASQVCPSTQYKFEKWRPKVRDEIEPPLTPAVWNDVEKEMEAYKDQPEVLMQRIGGMKIDVDYSGEEPMVTQTFVKATEPKDQRVSTLRRTRRTERLRALVEGINQEYKAEKAAREKLH